MLVHLLPGKTAATSNRCTGTTVLQNVVGLSRSSDQTSLGTAGTSLLHDNAVPTKQGPQLGVLRQKGDKCCPTHPAALTWRCVAVGSFLL